MTAGTQLSKGLLKLRDTLLACQQSHLALVVGRQVVICAIWQHLKQEAGRRQCTIGKHRHQRHLHQHQLQGRRNNIVSTIKASSEFQRVHQDVQSRMPRTPISKLPGQ